MLSFPLFLPLIAAAPLPHAKAGLWLVEQSIGARTYRSRFCSNDDSRAAMLEAIAGVSPSICHQNSVTANGNQVQIDSVCGIASSLLVAKATATYNDDSSFTLVVDESFAPPFMGKSQTHTTLAAHWTGACPFGMNPGDTVGPTGLETRFYQKAAKTPG